jgi:peptidoglycan/LPS O-acetylase OafA/YrhL
MSGKTFFPHLNSLRFIAFLAVFIQHVFNSLGYYNSNPAFKFMVYHFFSNGALGVSFFFVLSGFLITYLLIEEKETIGRVDIKKFYMRRILRIWPVYFLIVALALLVFPHFKETVPAGFPIRFATNKLNPWLYIGFAGNFDYLYNGISNVVIGILWSVSVEEQFYLFWPLIIAFVPKKLLPAVFLIVIGGSTLFRFYFSNGGNISILNHHSLSCISDLAVGALLAYMLTLKSFVARIRNMPAYLIEAVYFIGFASLPFREYIWKFGTHYVHVASILPVIIAFFFAFILMEQCYAKNSFYKAGNYKLFSQLGTYTYGMYCYHISVFFIVLLLYSKLGIKVSGTNALQFSFTSIVSLLITIGVSKLSYHHFEKKFLHLKKKFTPTVKKKLVTT